MKIHVINLKEAVERRKSITSQLQKLGLEFELFDAVRGTSLSEKDLAEKVDMNEVAKYPNWLTPNMLGCSLSHLGVYKRIVESESEWHLILEDDIELDNAVVPFLKAFESDGEKFREDIILFYTIILSGSILLEKKTLFEKGGRSIHKASPNQGIGSTGAYLIHKDTAKKILTNNPLVKVAPDTWHFFRDQGSIRNLNCIYPFLARPAFFESTIGYINKNSFLYKIKHFVDKIKFPILYQILKRTRKDTFEKMSKVDFI